MAGTELEGNKLSQAAATNSAYVRIHAVARYVTVYRYTTCMIDVHIDIAAQLTVVTYVRYGMVPAINQPALLQGAERCVL